MNVRRLMRMTSGIRKKEKEDDTQPNWLVHNGLGFSPGDQRLKFK